MGNDKIADALIYGTPLIATPLCVLAAVACPFLLLKVVFLAYACEWTLAFYDVMTDKK